MRILNLTPRPAIQEQIAVGVFEPENKKLVQDLLTFDKIPSFMEMFYRARYLADICKEHNADIAMIGGAPYFMPILEKVLFDNGIKPVYAFSVRISKEEILEDGTINKISTFKHEGFVLAIRDLYK